MLRSVRASCETSFFTPPLAGFFWACRRGRVLRGSRSSEAGSPKLDFRLLCPQKGTSCRRGNVLHEVNPAKVRRRHQADVRTFPMPGVVAPPILIEDSLGVIPCSYYPESEGTLNEQALVPSPSGSDLHHYRCRVELGVARIPNPERRRSSQAPGRSSMPLNLCPPSRTSHVIDQKSRANRPLGFACRGTGI
jgi:hypothetical protein